MGGLLCLWADADHSYWPRLSPPDLVTRIQSPVGTVIVERRASDRIPKGWNILSGFVKTVGFFHHCAEQERKEP